jgi:hypothetical protein
MVCLYFGLDGCCDMLIDFSLIRYMIATCPNVPSIIIHSLRIVVCFPRETELLDRLLEMVKGLKQKSIVENSFLWQFTGMKLIRQTAATTGAAVNTAHLLKSTRELTADLRQFWTSPDPHIQLVR